MIDNNKTFQVDNTKASVLLTPLPSLFFISYLRVMWGSTSEVMILEKARNSTLSVSSAAVYLRYNTSGH